MGDLFQNREEERGLAPPDPDRFVRSALLFYGGLGCAALLWRMLASDASIFHPDGIQPAEAMGLFPAIGWGVVAGIASLGFSEALTRWTTLGDGLADLVGESLAGIGLRDALLLAAASGLAEEMFFRGALQPAAGLLWASLIFGACHFVPRRDLLLWSVFAGVMGVVFGLLFEWTGHLAAPVAAHALINGVNLPRLAQRARELRAAERAAPMAKPTENQSAREAAADATQDATQDAVPDKTPAGAPDEREQNAED